MRVGIVGSSSSGIRGHEKYLADEPVSRILCAACPVRWLERAPVRPTQRGDHSSRSAIARGLERPTRGSRRLILANRARTGRAGPPLLFGLAPRGVFRAPGITAGAVGSYPTFSPLPNALDRWRRVFGFAENLPQRCKHHRRSIFCGTFRSRVPWRRTRARPIQTGTSSLALPGALPFTLRKPRWGFRRVHPSSCRGSFEGNSESGLSSRPEASGPAITRLTRQ